MREGTERPCARGCEGRKTAFPWAPRPTSGFHLSRIGELQETLLDMSLRSRAGEIPDESEWDTDRWAPGGQGGAMVRVPSLASA